MSDERYEPSKAEMLAALVTRQGQLGYATATVQRSHRFPVHLFVQLENLAKHADVPLSVIINELLECGLDALLKELPEDVAQKVYTVTKDQMERPTKSERFDSKVYREQGTKRKKKK
jgi:hypothetical protein